MTTRNKRKGFSMVELVIVIIILGIIAAIAIPRISSGSKNAGEAALRANLATVRNAIDWYYGEHKMSFPGAKADGLGNAAGSQTAFFNQLTMYSDADGNCSASKDVAFPYGPYIRGSFPSLPVGANSGTNTVTVNASADPLESAAGDGTGWIYSTATGEIIANADETGADGATYDNY
ncbi:MAG: prepilin-type N-terminal cleavage/methylation domain-containing protein [Sedimentisphaerales bacterium]|nr:prepilin-type N-terminal cleavage/methylation domain-containing protein [Sedimentisphaerales bacterium]